ncbi:hypothetical protein ECHHL_0740 [Ehrlichia chaffeensis str. Heartland]|nr:hypothetical protein ECHHL_0740 [Ehrlichia chaffeensis str. Heartland]AHX05388.1 hypothetical protein ECHJAX_0312 [Ehrlichia chaffeensis str. Jax]AHX06374.1 hypothetical protein ECHLIB_0307 [Ehrlichia chaffeensis str. Liberty]AHX08877.1 hypothetical protein ECHSTV_0301 [Ehrlichia chaffeensis str. Saint Vincent]AHX09277.1 hypothetical protein ECHWAK_0308 [Ehrlichia chaffeensis str. Wakulla]AHX10923.1 hypothetical protein ECHWP_0736 [Ehrlichia chaffeensis str. West Paces]
MDSLTLLTMVDSIINDINITPIESSKLAEGSVYECIVFFNYYVQCIGECSISVTY